ncbi:ATP-dependent Zn protease [Synechocystis salina LEGE 06155]|nr:ATP-dependent Zn protease [Synechocystis salina LEGE 06155]
MSDSRLNLVAIAIFLMMVSALVGPIVDLSPAIPAVVTLGILGIITADQISWQGRGTDFFVGLFQTKAEKERILCHEAGHFLVAHCLQIPITDYSLSPWEVLRQGAGGMAGIQFDTANLENQCRDWHLRPQALERWATVWMAGIAAEKIIYGEAQGGNGDRQQLRQAFRRAGLPEIKLNQKESWAFLQAKNLLEQHRQAHGQLQQALAQRRSVQECRHLLDQHLGGSLASSN